MKKQNIFLVMTLLITTSILIFFSCQKTTQQSVNLKNQPSAIEKDFHEMSVIISATDAKNLNERNMAPTVEDNCCKYRGGSIGVGRSWNIATCKSHCESGIGFNCGGSVYLRCQNGTNCDYQLIPPACPPDTTPPPAILNNSIVSSSIADRRMDANCIFYSNNTIKFLFQKTLPITEKNNNIMEVEDEVLNEFPTKVLLDKKPYKGFTAMRGNYPINRNDGKFGSVTIKVKLVE